MALTGACSGGGGAARAGAGTGVFRALTTNLVEGAVWELNRPIRIEFNHALDPRSVGFQSVLLRARDPGVTQPVTGSFELEPGHRALIFRPNCPTSETHDDGAFLPGGVNYELVLPTHASFGSTVLRDVAGRPLSIGLGRRFRSPRPPAESLYLDGDPAPPRVTGVDWPEGLNLFSDPDDFLRIRFDQPVDGRASNLTSERVQLFYADGEIGQAGEFDFLEQLPGTLHLLENCTVEGATVGFLASGLLPPNRRIRLIVDAAFRDIAGQTNSASQQWPDWNAPRLEDLFGDPAWHAGMEAHDEFRDDFVDPRWTADASALPLPAAELDGGQVRASFDFPGQFVSKDQDLYLDNRSVEIFTNGLTSFNDSNNRAFQVLNGVLYVDDLHLTSTSAIRGRGLNPLVIYVAGEARVEGSIDVSGNDARWPAGLNAPQHPEGGAPGECGGGDGGTSSQITYAETPRGEDGDGAMRIRHAGGQGGEGGVQQSNGLGGTLSSLPHLIAGGGGGGTFARTPNVAILWEDWSSAQRPDGADDFGPDHDAVRHPMFDPQTVLGGENGLRGSSWQSNLALSSSNPQLPHGAYGMEDIGVDTVALDVEWDPPWTSGATPPFPVGHPTAGPEGGFAGGSVFAGDPSDDFWGRRLQPDGSVLAGELLAPWAGSGGGASGDMESVQRVDLDFDGQLDPIPTLFPVRPFSGATIGGNYYRKGAPGGGAGGQFLLLAVGKIVLGSEATIFSNGGIGHGGEAVGTVIAQVSGSGGGSGGHIVLHSASQIDLSAIDIGTAATAAQLPTLEPADAFQARGGRRGWAASSLTLTSGGRLDGNSNFMAGRGGAGGNGLIQLHVPSFATDIVWPAGARDGIRDYLHDGDPLNNPVDPDRLEEVLGFFAVPNPRALLPFFSARSQHLSVWIDTGLASLRDPQDPNGQGYEGPYPDWADALLQFDGTDATGLVQTTGEKVTALAATASGPLSAASFGSTTVHIHGAAAYFDAHFLRQPALLVGYDVQPDASNAAERFEVVAADYERATDVLELTTLTADGAMSFVVQPGQPWEVRAKFFRVETNGARDTLPASAAVRVVFQGSADGGTTIVPGPGAWTADLASLAGLRWIRFQIEFDIDALGVGVTTTNARPALEYLKIPFAW